MYNLTNTNSINISLQKYDFINGVGYFLWRQFKCKINPFCEEKSTHNAYNFFFKKNQDVIFCEKKSHRIKDFGHEESVGFALSPGANAILLCQGGWSQKFLFE